MPIEITHKYVSENGDPPDPTLIGQTKWNDSHNIILSTDGIVVGRKTSGPGEAEELNAEDIAVLLGTRFLPDVESDPAPKLGGNLNLNGHEIVGLAVVATSGDYGDLTNKPVLGTAAANDVGDFATATQGTKADTAVQPGDLADVATSGSYSDLTGKPTLGTAAAHAETDFATAAQGAKADLAVQPGALGSAAAHDAGDFATAAQGAKADSALQSFSVAAAIHAATGKSTPVDADELGIVDSAASNVLKKLTWANFKTAAQSYFDTIYQAKLPSTPREVLTANRSYYVRTDGSDSNNGLANTSGGAFLTIQKAIDTACALDLSIYNVTINVADGTYSGGIALKPYLGTGPITIIGNTSTPANCLLQGTGSRIGAESTFSTYEMRGFETQTVTSGNSIGLSGIGILKLNNWRFGACAGSHLRIDKGARLDGKSGSFTISANATYFAIGGYSATIDFNSATITLDASVTFTATAYAQYMALVNFQQATFSLGAYSVTGQRYNASGLSLISSGGGGGSFIPGSTAGATSSGGTYL
jgi:hypothetical protein